MSVDVPRRMKCLSGSSGGCVLGQNLQESVLSIRVSRWMKCLSGCAGELRRISKWVKEYGLHGWLEFRFIACRLTTRSSRRVQQACKQASQPASKRNTALQKEQNNKDLDKQSVDRPSNPPTNQPPSTRLSVYQGRIC